VIGDNNDSLKELRRREAGVFGETERGSAIAVRLTQPSFIASNEFLLPHKNQGPAKAIPVGQEFNLVLSLRARADPKALEMATWSTLLLLTLGGIGRRSRRGAGSARIKAKTGTTETIKVPDEFSDGLKACLDAATTTAADKQALADRIADLLDKSREAFTTFLGGATSCSINDLAKFSVLCPDTRVVVWTPPNTDSNDYKTALTRLMNNMSNLKALLRSDFGDAFGGISPRRASPLHATAHRLEKEWALVLTHLKAKIQSAKDGKPEEVAKFLDSLDSKVEAYPRAAQGGSRP
jgi:CRISPR-associated protein Cmr1